MTVNARAVRASRSWPRPVVPASTPATIVLALALFAGSFVLRESDRNLIDGLEVLYVLPIALLAIRFGFRGGLAGALFGLVLIAVADLYDNDPGLTTEGYLTRGVAFLLLGTLLGVFVTKTTERTRELEAARAETLQRLAVAAEYHDEDTFLHTERVGITAAQIAVELGLATEEIGLVREAAPLHDVGKLAVSDTILLKPGKLTAQEREVMQTHAALGARLLSDSSSPVLQMAMVVAATHHERWDGTGYPAGLAGEVIPLVGRVVAVADVFDALTHDRPYKSAWPVEQAIAEIQRAAGSQFDPRVVAAFLTMHKDAVVPAEAGSPRQRARTSGVPRQRKSTPRARPSPRSVEHV